MSSPPTRLSSPVRAAMEGVTSLRATFPPPSASSQPLRLARAGAARRGCSACRPAKVCKRCERRSDGEEVYAAVGLGGAVHPRIARSSSSSDGAASITSSGMSVDDRESVAASSSFSSATVPAAAPAPPAAAAPAPADADAAGPVALRFLQALVLAFNREMEVWDARLRAFRYLDSVNAYHWISSCMLSTLQSLAASTPLRSSGSKAGPAQSSPSASATLRSIESQVLRATSEPRPESTAAARAALDALDAPALRVELQPNPFREGGGHVYANAAMARFLGSSSHADLLRRVNTGRGFRDAVDVSAVDLAVRLLINAVVKRVDEFHMPCVWRRGDGSVVRTTDHIRLVFDASTGIPTHLICRVAVVVQGGPPSSSLVAAASARASSAGSGSTGWGASGRRQQRRSRFNFDRAPAHAAGVQQRQQQQQQQQQGEPLSAAQQQRRWREQLQREQEIQQRQQEMLARQEEEMRGWDAAAATRVVQGEATEAGGGALGLRVEVPSPSGKEGGGAAGANAGSIVRITEPVIVSGGEWPSGGAVMLSDPAPLVSAAALPPALSFGGDADGGGGGIRPGQSPEPAGGEASEWAGVFAACSSATEGPRGFGDGLLPSP